MSEMQAVPSRGALLQEPRKEVLGAKATRQGTLRKKPSAVPRTTQRPETGRPLLNKGRGTFPLRKLGVTPRPADS